MGSHAVRPLTPLHAIVARTKIHPADKTAQSTTGERRIETENIKWRPFQVESTKMDPASE